ncbi:DUF1579 domain-containing protein [Flavobacterium arcticum]|uniref:DUF1579 domain-containing protein n=1 Tax=Flavobacterium arcticum TaxID=1784713 RepID=A0A345HEM4_9FLAO|nr:DUF1579 domain-containing protein [Flavobacterium arcticum]AXG75034.1 DUF1579 domain-containing protein [Flavobacterium arcticum]KAF2511183.1 DUF1579 domain-containing protein [Flavobacterium arcticum]
MKKIYVSLAVIAIAFASCKKEEKVEPEAAETMSDTIVHEEIAPEQPMDSTAMAQAWEKYMTPSEPHKMMADEVGKWDCEMTFWMAPDAPPETYKSIANIKMIMGGRYQESMYSGEMMGMPFEGRATVAYDNAANEYTSTWIDNMGTGLMVMKGKMKEGSNSMTLKGETIDPMTGKTCNMREVYTIVDENTRKMEMYDNKMGEGHKNMEIVMRRKM